MTGEGNSGEESCTVGEGELSGGGAVEGTVKEGAAGGSTSTTGSLGNACWLGDSIAISDVSFSALFPDPETPEGVVSFAVESGLSSAGRFAESKGSDAVVGTLNE